MDGGFFEEPVFQGQKHDAVEVKEVSFGKQCSSVRKPNENVFGRIKPRFKILETPIRMHSKVDTFAIAYKYVVQLDSKTRLLLRLTD